MLREPPPLATWLLEHLTTGDRDDALDGDLLEVFRTGRSNGWYWRQVLATCILSWSASLRVRVPLLVFVLMWSLAAPAWLLFMNRAVAALTAGWLWNLSRSAGPLPVLIGLLIWTVLNSSYLWLGILIYGFSLRSFGHAIDISVLRRAIGRAPLVFLPSMATTFILMNLYSYPGLKESRFAPTPLSQIADLRMPADVLRIPYVLTLLCVLWQAVPRSLRAIRQLAVASPATDTASQSDSSAPLSAPAPPTLRRFLCWMVGAGLINAMIVGFLLCRLPNSSTPTFTSLLVRAILYVAAGALAGAIGAWLYWRSPASPFRDHAPIPFPLFAVICASGWVWVPSMVMFYTQISAATAFVAMIGAFLLTNGLRRATLPTFNSGERQPSFSDPLDNEIFVDSLYRPPTEVHGYLIAFSLYAAGAALFTHSNYTAAALLALGASVFAWKNSATQLKSYESGYQYRQAAVRLALIAIPAILVTIWAMLDGVAHRNRVAAMNAAFAESNQTAGDRSHQKSKSRPSLYGLGGYQSIILWPVPEKPQIVAPVLASISPFAARTAKLLIIKFDGPYWYFQLPGQSPGPRAHQAHGTPTAVNIEANNFLQLKMEAVQNLASPIRLARCREVQVTVENRDNLRGPIAIGLALSDSLAPGKPSVSLGQQTILSSEPSQFSVKLAPVEEVLRFAVPQQSALHKFDQITVQYFPGPEHWQVGIKVAINQFELIPR